MRSPHCFIVEPKNGKRYDNTKSLGDKEFVVSSSQEDHLATNRIGIVESVPIIYDGPIKPGDEIIVHHNTFRLYHDMKGREKSSASHLFGDKFMIYPTEVYAYRNPNGKWNAIAPFCFIEPIKDENNTEGLINNCDELSLFGVMVYPNIEQSDIKPGTIISFIPDSEYEFNIDGKKLYRMKTSMICLVSERKY